MFNDVKNEKDFTLTIEDLRRNEGLEGLSDEDANNLIASLRLFSVLTFELFKTCNDDRFRDF
jgi:hypothetical protein